MTDTLHDGDIGSINLAIQSALGLGELRLRGLKIVLSPKSHPEVIATIIPDAGHINAISDVLRMYKLVDEKPVPISERIEA